MTPDKALHWQDLPGPVLAQLRQGAVIPAHPLALGPDRNFDRRSQRAISRYYVDAGSGGLAVGVHSTQFAIREAGLYRPVLELAIETARDWTDRPLVMIAGAVGRTAQAVEEARTARALGYHAVLLSLAAMKGASEDELIEHCSAVAKEMPLVGFYLQIAVGGIALSRAFWTRFAEIDNVVAIKVAPFNRYRTLDVAFGVVQAQAEDRITLYTGNDDHIVADRGDTVGGAHGQPRGGAALQGRPARALERVDRRRGEVAGDASSSRSPQERYPAGGAGAQFLRHRLQQRRVRRRPRLRRLHSRLPRDSPSAGPHELRSSASIRMKP